MDANGNMVIMTPRDKSLEGGSTRGARVVRFNRPSAPSPVASVKVGGCSGGCGGL